MENLIGWMRRFRMCLYLKMKMNTFFAMVDILV